MITNNICCTNGSTESGNSCQSNVSRHQLSSTFSISDRKASIMCRISNKFRMKYSILPGLYSIGTPDKDSSVLVTANYKLSVDAIRSALINRNAWVLVVDTKGINVWCAAGKGTFCTKAIVKQITECNLNGIVSHRTLILPQLGASGVNASKLQKESGYKVKYGPVRASDLPQYLDNHCTATNEMRRVQFSIMDRAKLIPMEAIPAFKHVLLFIAITAVLFGITNTGILYRQAIDGSLPFIIAGLTAILTGTVFTPLFLPLIPFRAFSLKGFTSGLIGAITIIYASPVFKGNLFLILFCLIAVPTYSSYLSLLFTGSTTYTSPSGVKKELKTVWPFYLVSASLSTLLFVIVLIRFWGIL